MDLKRGLFHCFHKGCDFSGGAVKLAREQGLTRPLSRNERQRLQREWERADPAGRVLYERVKVRRFERAEESRGLGSMELQAHEAGPDHPATWGALGLIYSRRPNVLAELTILENLGAADLIRFLGGDTETRRQAIDRALTHGGLYDTPGRFAEVTL